MQISRQSADSQQASRMPQSRSQGRSQSAHSPEPQQQQQRHESSELQEPHVAQSRTMLHSVRNSQNRQDRMQWTQQSAVGGRGGEGGWHSRGQGTQPQWDGWAGSLSAHCSQSSSCNPPAAPLSGSCEEPHLGTDSDLHTQTPTR